MSSNCPPQLQLSLPANTTSFKRSFEQFGFDLESPITGGTEPEGSNGGNGNGHRASVTVGPGSSRTGNERKRARSASCLSDGNDSPRSSGSSTFTGSSNASLGEDNELMAEPSGSSSSRMAGSISSPIDAHPPRLPTPDIDIEMPDYRQEIASSSSNEEFRISLEQLHEFSPEINILRHSRSPSLHNQRSPTLPPTLPPLSLEQSGDLPFLHSPTSSSPDRISFHSSSSSSSEDLLVRGLDAPPRLPSPMQAPSPGLSDAIPPFNPSIIHLNSDDDTADSEVPPPTEPIARYVSFRERLNTAVELLEADDVSSFRDRLTSALDAVRPDNRQSDMERNISSGGSRHIRSHHEGPAHTSSSGSRPRPSSGLNNMRNDSAINPPAGRVPRIRDLFGSLSSDSRLRPLYLASHSAVSRPLDSPSAEITDAHAGEGYNDTQRSGSSLAVSSSLFTGRETSPSGNSSSTSRLSHRLPSDGLFLRRTPIQLAAPTSSRQSAPASSSLNHEWGRWFEDPTDPSHLETSSHPSFATGDDSDDEWLSLMGQSLASTSRTGFTRSQALPDFLSNSTSRFASTGHTEDNDDQDREDEDIIASFLSSTQERANSVASSTGATTSGSSVGSHSIRAPPSLASLMARDDQLSAQDNDVVMHPADSINPDAVERTQNLSTPRRYMDVLSISEYRSQLLADSRRRRFIEQELFDPQEQHSEIGSSSSAGGRERRRNGQTRNEEPTIRLTAHQIPERSSPAPIRWQFSWNDALDTLAQTEPTDENDERATLEISDASRSYRSLRLAGLSGHENIPSSSLFGRSGLPDLSSRSHIDEQRLSRPDEDSSGSSSTIERTVYRRLRSRNLSSTRPSASNSLVAENAAELRRRSARADLMDHLFNDDTPHSLSRSSSRDYSRRSSLLGRAEVTPSLPPLRSPSPPDFHRSVADVLDAADRETEAQERRNREELSAFPRRLTNLSWLPPPQLPESFPDSSLDIDIGNYSDGTRDNHLEYTFPRRTDWLHRRSTMSSRHPDDSSRSWAHRTTPDLDDLGRTVPLRMHTHSSSLSSRPSRPESSGFFDSRHSSISDMARTITNNDRVSYPSFAVESDTGTSRSGSHEMDNHRHPHLVYPSAQDRPVNPTPFIDLGDFFSRGDLPSSPLNHTTSRPSTDSNGSLPSRMDTGDDDDGLLPRSYLRHSMFETAARQPYTVQSDLPSPLNVPASIGSRNINANEMLSRSYTYVPSHPDPPSRPSARPLSFSYTGIDGDSLAHRPFGSDMTTAEERNRWRSVNTGREAPSIPPLSFDEDGFESSNSVPREADYHARMRNHTAWPPRETQINHSSNFAPQRAARRGGDIHEAITRRARMEESLIEGSVPSSGSTSASPLADESFTHAIAVLRQDGLSDARSHQLINRYRQRREPPPTSRSWGDIENNDNTTANPYRFAPWSLRGDVGASNPTTSSSTATDTRTRMGNASTRRRPSPGPGTGPVIERPEDSRPRRLSARFSRNRIPDLASFGPDRELPFDLLGRSRRRGNFNLGDYMRDEDFDQSYEGLMSLAATLGEVKPRATPDHVVAGLKAGFYKEWVSEGCDTRCPICLDDYKALDPVLKLNDCPHWLHKSCLEQWLKGASTCPVCRKSVHFTSPHRHPRLRPHRRTSHASTRLSANQSDTNSFRDVFTPIAGPSGLTRGDSETSSQANTDNSSSDVENESHAPAARRNAPARGFGFPHFHWDYQPPPTSN